MKLAGEYMFDVPIDELWKALFDPVVLAASLPGCEKLEIVDGNMMGELNIKIGPIRGTFAGKIEFSDVAEPSRYTMVIDGRGTPGFVKATATIALDSVDEQTRLTYDSDSKVGGRLASVGQRLVGASARAIAKQTLDSLNATLNARTHAAATRSVDPEGNPAAELSALAPPSQAKFAAGVAKEIVRELLPPWARVALVIVVIAFIGWIIYALV